MLRRRNGRPLCEQRLGRAERACGRGGGRGALLLPPWRSPLPDLFREGSRVVFSSLLASPPGHEPPALLEETLFLTLRTPDPPCPPHQRLQGYSSITREFSKWDVQRGSPAALCFGHDTTSLQVSTSGICWTFI